MLDVLDEFTHESLPIRVARKLKPAIWPRSMTPSSKVSRPCARTGERSSRPNAPAASPFPESVTKQIIDSYVKHR